MDELLPLEVDCRTTRDLLRGARDVLLLDCREPDEWQTVHITEARLAPMSQIADRLDELAAHRDRPVIVHCHHGGRSLRVARWLREQGFRQAQSMAGGIDQWAVEIDPSLARY